MVNSSYFKNTEIAKEFGISSVSVGRYIEQASFGHNKLQIIKVRGKPRIRRNDQNYKIIKDLTSDETRFKNKGLLKILRVSDQIYDILNKKQILEIISNLQNSKYLPIKYAYFTANKNIWPNFSNESDNSLDQRNSLKRSLNMKLEYISSLCDQNNCKLNIVQLGTSYRNISNDFIDNLIDNDYVNSIILVDMNDQALKSDIDLVNERFDPTKVKAIHYDFERSYCKNFIYEELNALPESESKILNLFMAVGANLSNYPSYSKIVECMSDVSTDGDLLIYDLVMYHKDIKYIHNFSEGTDRNEFLTSLPKMLGFKKEDLELHSEYNPENQIRSVYFSLKENTNIIIDNLYLNKPITIKFSKGDRINVMNTKITDFIYDVNMLRRKSYTLLQSTLSINEKFITLLARKSK